MLSRFLSPDAVTASGAPVAAAAPAAAPVAPALPADGAPAPTPHPITDAIQAARSRVENNQPIVEIPEQGTPDADGNNEVIDLSKQTPEPTVAEGLDQPAEPAKPEGEEVFVLKYPGRNPGDPDFEVQTADRDEYERHQQMVNGYRRTMELETRAQMVAQQKDSLDETAELIKVSPVAFTQRFLAPQARLELLMSLVTDPDVVDDSVREQLGVVLSDEKEARAVHAETRARAIQADVAAKDRVVAQREVNRNVQECVAAIHDAVPPGLSGEQRNQFIIDSRREVAAWARDNNKMTVDVRDIPLILQTRITAYGGDPQQVAARIAARTRRAAPAPVASGQPRPGAAPAQPTGPQLVRSRQARMAGSVVGPAGAGAPPAGASPLPKYDPKLGGTPIEQRARAARDSANQ